MSWIDVTIKHLQKAMQSVLQNVTNIKCVTKCNSMLFDNAI